jgi:hypothetical protein
MHSVIASLLVIVSLSLLPLGMVQVWRIFSNPDNTPYDDD